jgi:hypothetical protein
MINPNVESQAKKRKKRYTEKGVGTRREKEEKRRG